MGSIGAKGRKDTVDIDKNASVLFVYKILINTGYWLSRYQLISKRRQAAEMKILGELLAEIDRLP